MQCEKSDWASALISLVAGAGVLAVGLWLSVPGAATRKAALVEESVLFSAPGPERVAPAVPAVPPIGAVAPVVQ